MQHFKEPPIPIEEIGEGWDGEGIIQLIYGRGGTGKTEYIGSIGERGLILNCRDGQMTLKNPDHIQRHPKRPKIAYLDEKLDPNTGMFIRAEAWDRFTDFCEWFLEQDDFDTLAADDATKLSMYARNRGMVANFELGHASNTIAKSNLVGFAVPEIQDYGKEISIWVWFFNNYLPKFKERKKNFILTAHERHIYTKGPRLSDPKVLSKILPGFTGDVLPDALQNYFDFVWLFEVTNGTVFRAVTIPNGDMYLAKTRWAKSRIPEYIKDPDFLKLVHCLKSGKKYGEV